MTETKGQTREDGGENSDMRFDSSRQTCVLQFIQASQTCFVDSVQRVSLTMVRYLRSFRARNCRRLSSIAPRTGIGSSSCATGMRVVDCSLQPDIKRLPLPELPNGGLYLDSGCKGRTFGHYSAARLTLRQRLATRRLHV